MAEMFMINRKLEAAMKVSDITRSALAHRREQRDLSKNGWERVGEEGGRLWELHRGWRWNHHITDVRVSVDGKSLWIKTAAKEADNANG